MKLHEYQSKFLFQKYGIPIPEGKVAATADEAHQIASEMGGAVVVKAQVHVGGRGKAGGVRLARNADEARSCAQQILGMDIKGFKVEKALIDPAADIQQEIYLAITNDRSVGKPLIMTSMEGGMDIEELNRERPQAIVREHIDPLLGLQNYQMTYIASAMGLPRGLWPPFGRILRGLHQCYRQSDAELVEINPLAITSGGDLLAVDGKAVIDDNALYRQPELAAARDASGEPASESQAREAGIAYIKLDGQIGCMVNGAGLAMATMDAIKLEGGDPANFLDIGTVNREDRVIEALRIIHKDPDVKAILINIFGGLARVDIVAEGVVKAIRQLRIKQPIIVRLNGSNVEEGRRILEESGVAVQTADALGDAARLAAAAAA